MGRVNIRWPFPWALTLCAPTPKASSPLLAISDGGGGAISALDIALQIATEAQQVSVSDTAAGQLSTDASANVGALVLKNSDLDALPDDPDDLQSDLEALAGPAAGPNGAQFFVDGFSGGQFRPRVRSAKSGSTPTRSPPNSTAPVSAASRFYAPGTDNFHGSLFINYGNQIFDTRNPFLATEPGYNSKIMSANVSGPINKKLRSFSISTGGRLMRTL